MLSTVPVTFLEMNKYYPLLLLLKLCYNYYYNSFMYGVLNPAYTRFGAALGNSNVEWPQMRNSRTISSSSGHMLSHLRAKLAYVLFVDQGLRRVFSLIAEHDSYNQLHHMFNSSFSYSSYKSKALVNYVNILRLTQPH